MSAHPIVDSDIPLHIPSSPTSHSFVRLTLAPPLPLIALLFGMMFLFVKLPSLAWEFRGVGQFPGMSAGTIAKGVSADGQVVVGYGAYTTNGTPQAFRWTVTNGIEGLGFLASGSWSSAYGVSGNGAVIAGEAADPTGRAFKWTLQGGMVGLGNGSQSANSVSFDGQVIVGRTLSGSDAAVRWVNGGIAEVLGWLPDYDMATAAGVSGNGSVVVGWCNKGNMPATQAFKWTANTGISGLGYLSGGSHSWAFAISSDGAVIVGESGNDSGGGGNEAFRWTAASGMVGLGDLPGGEFSSDARGVSSDGKVIVGRASVTGRAKAFIWDVANGMIGVEDLLAANGVTNIAGWQLYHANGVSADGSVVVGWGRNPSGQGEGWVAVIGPRIISQPQSQIRCIGRTVTFSVNAIGPPPLLYQWFHNSAPISTATNANLVISNVSSNDAGVYSAIVSSASAGETESTPASLTVQPVCVSIELHPGLLIGGITGQTYRIDYVESLSATNDWLFLTNVTLTQPDQLWFDPQPARARGRYYRVLPTP
jgi:probable HAF family extracellular repeat protein